MLRSSKHQLSTLSPARVFAATLVIVFAVELTVMVLLPRIAPASLDSRILAVLDSSLLTLGAAPILWYVIILPLRRIAVNEQARAELIVREAAEGIITVDEHGTLDSVNPAAARTFGYAVEELEGRNVEWLIPGGLEITTPNPEIRKKTAFGRPIEVRGRQKNGADLPLELSLSELRLGGKLLITGMLRDLRENKERAAQQAAMVEFGHQALACSDLGELLGEANACVARVLHTPFSIVMEFTSDSRFLVLQSGAGWPPEQIGRVMIDAAAGFGEQAIPVDKPLTITDFSNLAGCPNGRLFADHGAVSALFVVIHGGERPFGILGACSRQRREFNADEVRFLQEIAIEITLALQRKRAEVEQRQRDLLRAEQMAAVAQIATAVAHEIRNPLTAIKMLVQAEIEREAGGRFNREDLCIIEGEIRRMERSLKTFLDFARPSKPERRPRDLRILVDRNFALIRPRAIQQDVTLDHTVPDREVVVAVDSDQVQQLLLNLTMNALDAMPNGGRLCVQIDGECDDCVRLRVLDSGPGIQPAILPRLFEPFVSTKDTGMGLGLVVSKRIAEDHGGRLSVDTSARAGACFTLTLPVADEAHA